jgi:hypothetical protein
VYRQFVMPSLLLDGLARVGVLGLVCGRYIPVAAPSSIRRIDLFEAGSDAELAARYSRLDLSVTPAGLDLEEAGAPNRFVACAPDGHVVAQMHDVRGIVLGFVDAHTGERVERHLVEALAAPAQPFPPSSHCQPTWAGDLDHSEPYRPWPASRPPVGARQRPPVPSARWRHPHVPRWATGAGRRDRGSP